MGFPDVLPACWQGDTSELFYGYWIKPVFWALAKLPQTVSFMLWSLINLTSVLFASRVLGGKSWLALFSYQMIYVLFYGQITGLILGGLALAWLGMTERRPHLAGMGFLIAAVKPQYLIICLILRLMGNISWKERLLALTVPSLASF